MTSVQREWRVRAALRIENWSRVQSTIEALTDNERNASEWVYWLARARVAQGDSAAATALYERIAAKTDFYGLLAAEELGRLFPPPPADATVADRDRARASTDPGVQRALAFYKLDLTTEAVREWFRAVRNRDREFLIAAAHIALEHGLYDRAINTAELADPGANFALRFIAPYRELVEPQVIEQGLDLAWVYGLMRQESRFIVPARSSAGAQGLMQVMPATGKWVAERIGLSGYSARMLTDPHTNVLLGTSYMRLILGDLDNHPVLASAGYNAGPGRARRWRDDKPIEAAIYIETIPGYFGIFVQQG
jgi:soluble lytic murein transglycosylase